MNNKKLFCVIEPFRYQQSIFEFENNLKVNELSVSISGLPSTLVTYAKEKDITKVSITGPNTYSKKIINDIKKTEYSMFNKNELDIELI